MEDGEVRETIIRPMSDDEQAASDDMEEASEKRSSRKARSRSPSPVFFARDLYPELSGAHARRKRKRALKNRFRPSPSPPRAVKKWPPPPPQQQSDKTRPPPWHLLPSRRGSVNSSAA